jgi:GNAT superfamily N-acetyltransferase
MQMHMGRVPIAIRAGHDKDARLIRGMAPALFTERSAPDRVLVAQNDTTGEIVGVAAIAWQSWGIPPAFPLWIHVCEAWRRQGIARALLRHAARDCREDIDRLCSWTALEESSAAAAFARAVGFEVARRKLYFEAEGEPLLSAISPIYERLRAAGRIPADARVVTLRDAPYARVARLVSETFDSRYDYALAAVHGPESQGYDRDSSVVLLLGGTVCGALLYRWSDSVAEIGVNVVAPHVRRRWANVALLYQATRNGFNRGGRRVRFHCDDTVTDTVNIARRIGADLLRTTLEFSATMDLLDPSSSSNA